MNKRILIFLIFLFSVTSIFCYSKNPAVKINAYVVSYGNVPFTFPGLVTIDNKKYAVIANEKIKKELFGNIGFLLEIEGYIVHNEKDITSLDDGSIIVIGWKKI